MTTHTGAARPGSYAAFHEMWYAPSCRPDPGSTQTGRELHVLVGPAGDNCGLHITEHAFVMNPGTPVERRSLAVRIAVWNDGWGVFTRAPELFARLTALADSADETGLETPAFDDVRALLDELGYADTTVRVNPDDEPGPGQS